MENNKNSENRGVLVRMRGVKTWFPVRKGVFKTEVGQVKAVDGVDLDIYRGEIVGIVGESGCGKTTLGKSLLQLVKPTGGTMELRTYSSDGRLVASQSQAARMGQRLSFRLDGSRLANGIYMVQVVTPVGVYAQKTAVLK